MYPLFFYQNNLNSKTNYEFINYLLKNRSISHTSLFTQINPNQATKKPYSELLLIYIRGNEILAFGEGTWLFHNKKVYKYSYKSNDFPNRKELIFDSTAIYQISISEKIKNKRNLRCTNRVSNNINNPEIILQKRIHKYSQIIKDRKKENLKSLFNQEKIRLKEIIENQLNDIQNKILTNKSILISGNINLLIDNKISKCFKLFENNSYFQPKTLLQLQTILKVLK